MKIRTMIAAFAAMSMSATPVLAASANPAAALSIGHARAGATAKDSSDLAGFGGAGLVALLIVAGIAAIIVVDATKNDSDSN